MQHFFNLFFQVIFSSCLWAQDLHFSLVLQKKWTSSKDILMILFPMVLCELFIFDWFKNYQQWKGLFCRIFLLTSLKFHKWYLTTKSLGLTSSASVLTLYPDPHIPISFNDGRPEPSILKDLLASEPSLNTSPA